MERVDATRLGITPSDVGFGNHSPLEGESVKTRAKPEVEPVGGQPELMKEGLPTDGERVVPLRKEENIGAQFLASHSESPPTASVFVQ